MKCNDCSYSEICDACSEELEAATDDALMRVFEAIPRQQQRTDQLAELVKSMEKMAVLTSHMCDGGIEPDVTLEWLKDLGAVAVSVRFWSVDALQGQLFKLVDGRIVLRTVEFDGTSIVYGKDSRFHNNSGFEWVVRLLARETSLAY